MNKQDWLSLPCETVPENFAGVVEREKPNLLVIVDAADMGLASGEFRLLAKESLNSAVVGTHGLPLKHLVERLEKSAEKIIKTHRKKLDRIGNALLEYETLTGDEIAALIKNKKIDRDPSVSDDDLKARKKVKGSVPTAGSKNSKPKDFGGEPQPEG